MMDEADMIVVGRPVIDESDIEAVVRVLQSGWIGPGTVARDFGDELRTVVGGDAVLPVASCSAALHLSLLLAGIGHGDEVITTPLTFCATPNAIDHVGAVPVLADIEGDTLNVSPERIEEVITPRTRAVVGVHFGGRPFDVAAVAALCRDRDLVLVEDCAHALGARIRGQHVGTFGDYGCFSFYATKNVTTIDGGALVASAPMVDRARVLASQGQRSDAWDRLESGVPRTDVVEIGFKYMLNDVNAALGLSQLRRLPQWQARRAQIWQAYQEALEPLPVQLPAQPAPGTDHGYHLFPIRIPAPETDRRGKVTRDEALEKLRADGIVAAVHYPSLTSLTAYRTKFGWSAEQCPVAHEAGEQLLSLPLGPHLSDADVERVVSSVVRLWR